MYQNICFKAFCCEVLNMYLMHLFCILHVTFFRVLNILFMMKYLVRLVSTVSR